MVVIVPDTLTTTDTTLLWLGSGGNTDDLPDFSDIGNDYELLIAGGLATANNIVTSIVFQVPHHFLPHLCLDSEPEDRVRRGPGAELPHRGREHRLHLVPRL